jgi:hypothetical protein
LDSRRYGSLISIYLIRYPLAWKRAGQAEAADHALAPCDTRYRRRGLIRAIVAHYRKRNARMNKQSRIGKSKYSHPADERWRRIFTAVSNPDLQLALALSLIGLLLTLYIMFRFPDLGALIAQYNQF